MSRCFKSSGKPVKLRGKLKVTEALHGYMLFLSGKMINCRCCFSCLFGVEGGQDGGNPCGFAFGSLLERPQINVGSIRTKKYP